MSLRRSCHPSDSFGGVEVVPNGEHRRIAGFRRFELQNAEIRRCADAHDSAPLRRLVTIPIGGCIYGARSFTSESRISISLGTTISRDIAHRCHRILKLITVNTAKRRNPQRFRIACNHARYTNTRLAGTPNIGTDSTEQYISLNAIYHPSEISRNVDGLMASRGLSQ